MLIVDVPAEAVLEKLRVAPESLVMRAEPEEAELTKLRKRRFNRAQVGGREEKGNWVALWRR